MYKYVAFLRAINVGGRTVKMEKLRSLLTAAGYAEVQTYIQSGNFVFKHHSEDVAHTERDIAQLLQDALGYEVATFIYTPIQLRSIIDDCPYKEVPENMAVHVSMLSDVPDSRLMEGLESFQNEYEQYKLCGRILYIMVLQGKYGETKFSNTFLEKKLKIKATTRNWATITKMASY